MADQEAVDFISSALEKGKSKKEVKKDLKEAGYSKEKTAEIMEEATGEEEKEKPVEDLTFEEENKNLEPGGDTMERKKTKGSKSIVSLLISYFLNFWVKPFKAMKDVVENRKYIPAIITLLIAFSLVFGSSFYNPSQESSSYGGYGPSYEMKQMKSALQGASGYINPASTLKTVAPMIQKQSLKLLISTMYVFLPLLGLLFTATMVLKAIKGKIVKFREVARITSVPYSVTITYSMIFSLLSRYILSTMNFSARSIPWLKIIPLFLLGFLTTFLSIYVYVLYTRVISQKYDINMAAALGAVITAAIVMILITLPMSMLMTGAMMGGFGF